MPEGIATRLSRILGGLAFQRRPKASSRVSAGTNDGEAPSCYTPPFRLALSIGGVANSHMRIKLGHWAVTRFNDILDPALGTAQL